MHIRALFMGRASSSRSARTGRLCWAPGRGSSSASSTGRAHGQCTSRCSSRGGRGGGGGGEVGDGYSRAVATAPIRTGDEVELRIESLAYGGNGVGRLDPFVVFVRGGLPGDLVRARATKVKRAFAEATRTELVEPGPDRVTAPCRHFGVCGGCRFQDYAYEQQIASKEAQVRDSLTRLGGFPDPPVASIVPAEQQYGYRASRVLLRAGRRGPRVGVPPRRPLGPGHRRRGVLADDGPRQCGQGSREAMGARGGPRAVRPGDGHRVSPPPRRPRGQEHPPVLVLRVTAPGERFDADFLVETLTRFPEVRSIHWGVNDRPAEVTNLPTRLFWGDEWIEEELSGLRFRIRPSRVSPDEHRDGREALRPRAGGGAVDRHGDRLRPLLRHRHDRAVGRRRRRLRVGRRDLRGVGCVRDRERDRERDRQRTLLRGQRRAVDRGAPGEGGPTGCRGRRPPARGPRGQSPSPHRRTPGPPARLRLLQPDDARIGPRGAPRRLRLPPRALTPVDMFPHTPHIESVSSLVFHPAGRRSRMQTPRGNGAAQPSEG